MAIHKLSQKFEPNSNVRFWECVCGKDFGNKIEGEHHVAGANAKSKPFLAQLRDDPGLLRTHLYGGTTIKDDRGKVLLEVPVELIKDTHDVISVVLKFMAARMCIRCDNLIEVDTVLCAECAANIYGTLERWEQSPTQ